MAKQVAREFQVFPDLGGSYRVRMVDTQNGNTLMSSEAYYNHGNAMRFAEREASLQADGGRVKDLTTEDERKAGWWKRLWS